MAIGLTICQACIDFEIMSAHSHANQVSGQCETKIYFAWPTLCDMSTTVYGERLPGEYAKPHPSGALHALYDNSISLPSLLYHSHLFVYVIVCHFTHL